MLHIVVNNLRNAWHGLLNVRKVDPQGHAFMDGILLADLLLGAGRRWIPHGQREVPAATSLVYLSSWYYPPAVKTPSTRKKKSDVARVWRFANWVGGPSTSRHLAPPDLDQ